MGDVKIGVIGGSGLYEMEGLEVLREEEVSTPYGDPSDAIIIGKLAGREVAFLPRHGRGHALNPTSVPYQANIWAMKKLGVETILSVSAVGSLKEEIVPGHFVIPDQIIDRTKHRPNTMFDPIAVHVSFGDPYCEQLRQLLIEVTNELELTVHDGGTYVCMEGPLFSTRAESELHRSWGASVIGMTGLPEAKLAREAEICYANIACSTDYDCWHKEEVTVEMVIKTLLKNVANVQKIIAAVIPKISPETPDCKCQSALENAIMTSKEMIPEEKIEAFELFMGKYWKE